MQNEIVDLKSFSLWNNLYRWCRLSKMHRQSTSATLL